MFNKKKKLVLLGVMVALLVATGILNVVLNNNIINTGGTTSAGFFASYKQDRTLAREQEIMYYDAIIADTTNSAEAIANAESQRLALIANMETEIICEGLIKKMGFPDVIITSGNNYLNVVVNALELTAVEVAQIVDIVMNQTNIEIDFIKVSPIV